MYRCFGAAFLAVCCLAGVGSFIVSARDVESKPFGIAERIPLTTSRVIGQPDPPPPFRVKRVYPGVGISFPVAVAAEPGTSALIISHQKRSFGPSTISRLSGDRESAGMEILIEFPEHIVYNICFHPRYHENGFVYFGCNGPLGADSRTCRILRYTVSRTAPFALDPGSATTIIEWSSSGHDGTAMAFDQDGLMYVTTGDGTSDSDTDIVGQRLDLLLGKVLRIDVDHPDEGRGYSVPQDNPFVGQQNVRPETWAYGLRAPWRAAVDPQSGQLWVTQNGQDLWEHTFAVRRGANYGWSVYEGNHPFYLERPLGPTPVSPPTFEHPHSEARSLMGGAVYYGDRLPGYEGAYFYGDYSTGKIWAGKVDAQHQVILHRLVADSTLAITSFCLDANGQLLITDHRGDDQGGLYTLEPVPTDSANRNFPHRLSESGLFDSVKDHAMAPGVIPYSVNSPLWSDGAFKARYIAIPESSGLNGRPPQITFDAGNAWGFPDGTVLIKSFAFDDHIGDHVSRRWIETRFLHRENNEWVGYSYEWTDDQTDAILVSAAGASKTFVRSEPDGNTREQLWRYPGRTECMVCHTRAAAYVLGLSTPQMNRDHDYPGPQDHEVTTDNQLRTLQNLGLLPGMDRSPGEYHRLADPNDLSQPLETRARSYLHANCANCHVEAGGGNSGFDVKYSTPLEQTNLVGVKPLHQSFGIDRPQIIAPGDPERSVLVHRMKIRSPGQMPVVASQLTDHDGVRLIEEWIRSLPRTEPESR